MSFFFSIQILWPFGKIHFPQYSTSSCSFPHISCVVGVIYWGSFVKHVPQVKYLHLHIQTFYHAKGTFYKEDGNPTEWKQWNWPPGSEYSTHNKITTCENIWQRQSKCLQSMWWHSLDQFCFSYGSRTPPAGPSTRTRCRSRWSRLTWSRD